MSNNPLVENRQNQNQSLSISDYDTSLLYFQFKQT